VLGGTFVKFVWMFILEKQNLYTETPLLGPGIVQVMAFEAATGQWLKSVVLAWDHARPKVSTIVVKYPPKFGSYVVVLLI
jgi:hypothetical protein